MLCEHLFRPLAHVLVLVRWSTHSAGGVTEKDRELAATTDSLA